MRKFWSLARVNVVMSFYQLSLMRRRTGKREGRGFQYGLAAVAVVVVAYMGFWAWVLSIGLNPIGYEWVILPVGLLIISAMIFAFGLYTLNSVLFESSDTDQLFAYPLSKFTIVAGKVGGLVVENWLVSAVFWLPFVAVYGWFAHPGFVFYLFALVCLLIMPGVPLFAMGLISFITGVVASGVRFRRFLSVIVTIGLVAGLGVAVSRAINHLKLDAIGGDIFAAMQRYYPPIGYATTALATGSAGAMALAVVWNVVPFLLLCGLISLTYTYIRSRTQMVAKPKTSRVTYTAATTSSALLRKEFARLLASPNYLLNSFVGLILLWLVAFFVGRIVPQIQTLISLLRVPGLSVGMLLLAMFLMLLALTNTTAPSISLEGKSLWVVQSLPLRGVEVLKAKLTMHVAIIVPGTLVAAIIATITCHLTPGDFWQIVLPCVLFTTISGCLGLIYNLHFHRFDFYNDQQAVKNSASVLLTMGSMLALMLVIELAYLGISLLTPVNLTLYWFIWVVLLAAGAVWAYRYVMTKGVALFETLG